MKRFSNTRISMTVLAGFALSAMAQDSNVLTIDGFDDPKLTNTGFTRMFMDDQMVGGSSAGNALVKDGLLSVTGSIVPARGQLGWVSTVLPLDNAGENYNAAMYDGIELRVKVNQGNIVVSANSNEVSNFDYHAAPVIVSHDGEFHDVKVPFNTLKQAWSGQTELDPATLNSLSIVAYGLKKESFAFVVDSVSFYSATTD